MLKLFMSSKSNIYSRQLRLTVSTVCIEQEKLVTGCDVSLSQHSKIRGASQILDHVSYIHM